LDEVKVWRCKGDHVLGIVVRNGNGIRQLLLYREAVGDSAGRGSPASYEEVDVVAVIEGRVVDVRCSICGRVRTWVPLDL